ncbi:MAG: methionine--tRNA ligase [Candidatus Bathyarchaeia archaeon]
MLVTCAWPYINHVPHLGTLLPVLSADVIARYHRLKGDDVVFVSGSDEHGTPIEVEAIRQEIHPKELTDRNHKIVSDLFVRYGISFDNYSRTENPTHIEFVRETWKKIEENGYVFTQQMELPYCERCGRFLPDRFVEGKCPLCGYEEARGDQCDNCGRLLEPIKLIEPHCTICGTRPKVREVTHWYFDLPKFTDRLFEYIENNKQLPDNARNFSLNLLKEGLKPRPVTRDTEWAIPAPFEGANGKTIYGWFENVLGYVSATLEYFENRGQTERWRDYWFEEEARTLFFIGKDNIPFHTLFLPALLLATHEGYNLPWNVSTNEWLTFKGQWMSKSRRVGIWLDEALQLFPTAYWRYTLISIRPETRDSNFTWKVFLEKVNSDLNDTIGNFIHRTLTFINRYFKGVIPEAGGLDKDDKRILQILKTRVGRIAKNLEAFRLQAALRDVTSLSRLGNRYLNEKQPWKTVKMNPRSAASTLYVAAQIVKALSIVMEPFMPFASKELRSLLNLSEKVEWKDATRPIPSGHRVGEAKPLFQKIEASEEEIQDMLERVRSAQETVSFDDFSRIDLRVGRIVKAEPMPESSRLLKLTIDVGRNQQKTAVAGIAGYYKPEELEGRLIAVVVNLAPRKIMGVNSEVMILASQDRSTLALIQPDRPVKTGSRIS